MQPFDFDSLRVEIQNAARQALQEVVAEYGTEAICGFSLYSDDGAMTVCPATNTLAHLRQHQERTPEEADYYKFSPAEWALEGDGAVEAFNAICTKVRTYVMALDEDEDRFVAFRDQLFETCVTVLEELRKAGEFQRFGIPQIPVVFAVSDSDPQLVVECARMGRLNDPELVAEHRAWTDTWRV
jgi:hypothetical protein